MGFASQRCPCKDHERRATALLEPVLLPPPDDEDVPRLQSRLPAPEGQCPAPRRDEDLVLPVVPMDRGATALLDPDFMEGRLLRAVLPPGKLLHQDASRADLSEPYRLEGPDVRPVHLPRESRVLG